MKYIDDKMAELKGKDKNEKQLTELVSFNFLWLSFNAILLFLLCLQL